ncbi:MAG TPA: Ig domain-containing protein [Nannocystaceae bacterium]|nr:Ig domain-containing protein [Nannocystaceae bacterium]
MLALGLGLAAACSRGGGERGDGTSASGTAEASASETAGDGATTGDDATGDTGSAGNDGADADGDGSTDAGESSDTGAATPPCPGRDGSYPLEIISPMAVGPAPTGLDAGHRVFRAYPGMPYEIRIAAVGGSYPFTYALGNAPEGMTIDPYTGEIRWPDPQADAIDVTVTVTDSMLAEVSQTWSIAVDVAGFVFVDAVQGSSAGSGTLDDPLQSLADAHERAGAGTILVLRGGDGAIYGVEGMPVDNPDTDEERIEWQEETQPVIWLAHPDDSPRPVVDFGYTGAGEDAFVPRIRLSGSNIYVDGIETANSFRMAFQIGHDGQHGSTFRRNYMHDGGPGIDGGNSAFIMYIRCDGCPAHGAIVQDNEFAALESGTSNSGLKLYSLSKVLIADNDFHDIATLGEAVIAIKDSIVQFDVRGNEFWQLEAPGIGGNMSMTDDVRTFGEIRYNNVRTAGATAMFLNQDALVGELDVYRNTLQGRVEIRWIDATNGPVDLRANVVVNDDADADPMPFYDLVDVSEPSRITDVDGLYGTPADGIVDDAGDLQGAYAEYLGTRGHELGTCE